MFMPAMWDVPKMVQLEAGVSYRAFYFNPATAAEHPAGMAVADAAGVWQPPVAPVFQDWVLVLDRGKDTLTGIQQRQTSTVSQP